MDLDRVARETTSTPASSTTTSSSSATEACPVESNSAAQEALVDVGGVEAAEPASSSLSGRQVGVLANFGIGPENLDDEAQARLAHAINRLDGMLACDGGDEAACDALGPAPISLSDATSADGNEQEILLEESDYTLSLKVSTDPLTGATTSRLLYIDADGTCISGLSNQPVETLFAPEPTPEAEAPAEVTADASPDEKTWLNTLADLDADYHVLARLGGALQAYGAASDLAVAVPLLLAPEPTMLTKVAAAGAGLRGLDDLQAGLRTLISGEPTETVTQTLATDAALALGADPEAAGTIGLGADMVTGLLNPAGRLRHMTTEASERLAAEAAEQAGRHTDDAARTLKTEEEVAKDTSRRSGVTGPSGEIGGKPTGQRTEVGGSVENRRALTRENEAADALANAGYKVEQNPVPTSADGLRETAMPDYRVEGKIFDCYSPGASTDIEGVRNELSRKVKGGQTRNVVVNLTDSGITPDELRFMLEVRKPVRSLEEVLAVVNGQIIQIFP